MASFRFTWISGIVALGLLTLLVFWIEVDPEGPLGLGRGASLVLGIWLIGLGWIALLVLHERATRRRLVKAARREAVREVTQRTAEVAAHELAQPLTVVLAYAQWLQRSAVSPKDQRYYLEQMVAACHEMAVILKELYETIRHSRAQAGLTIVDEPLPPSESDVADTEEDASSASSFSPVAAGGREPAWR